MSDQFHDPRPIESWTERFGTRDVRDVASHHPSSSRDLTPPTGIVRKGPAVTAFVNTARWIACCPNPYCSGAEVVNFDNPVFFCCECRNAGFGHDLLPVVLPDDRDQIELLLLDRPDLQTRNWLPHETLADLQAENDAHGIVGP